MNVMEKCGAYHALLGLLITFRTLGGGSYFHSGFNFGKRMEMAKKLWSLKENK